MMVYNINSRNKTFIFLCWLDLAFKIAGIILTATPSNIVEVNQTVTLQCVLDPNPVDPLIVSFTREPSVLLCTMEPDNGKCKNTNDSCGTYYNASCPSKTVYSVEVNVPLAWNGISLFCQSVYSARSNRITFDVTVPVELVTLTPTSITVTDGQQLNLTCETSYCFPSANITWHKSMVDITSQSTSIISESKGLKKTTSIMQSKVNRTDNGKQVYCTAINTPPRSKQSNMITLIVHYKPDVSSTTSNPYQPIEGQAATLKCEVTTANPNTDIKWEWFKTDSQKKILHRGPNYAISNIYRNMSGFYNCIAINSVGPSEAIMTFVDVLYKPDITSKTPSSYNVMEGQTATLECEVTAANPNTSITWQWFNASNHNTVLFNGAKYTIPYVKRNQSGLYSCTANNSIGASKPTTINMNIQYKPEVIIRTVNPYTVLEGTTAELVCSVIDANPTTGITWEWIKTEVLPQNKNNVLYNGPNYTIPKIQRKSSGSYNCRASNIVDTSVAAKIYVDVQYQPEISNKSTTIVNETDYVVLSREIVSNPLANVSWYNGSQLLHTQIAEKNATFIIKRAMCTDTKNLTLLASNTVQENVSALVELIVNCKPRSIKTNFTLGVTDSSGIEFSTTVIAYPKPLLELKHANGTINKQMTDRILPNGTNTFTIHLSQAIVNQSDFGVYHLIITNAFGNITIFVNVVPQRKPIMPENIEIRCDETRARVQWTSSFNGGDTQTFTVFALNGQQSNTIPDQGENEIHAAYVKNLQTSTTYVFYVSARNTRGFSLSNNISCTTLPESNDNLPLIAGGAAAGGIALAIIVIVIVVLLRIYTKREKQGGKTQRFENEVAENKEADVDGLKENSLYVSAGPRDDEKTEVAVYAAVAKKIPQSDNNSNLYADVKKSGRQETNKGTMSSEAKPKKGLFKKDEKAKHKKGKKPKNRPGEADVYENSEDIAMSTNVDNVYSNAAQKGQNKQKERGYKNKDGLLYVEVNFDGKQGQDNPIIHGEDEKTDYATVEFPMSSPLHKASGSEEL